jgi:hypothetical protein
MAIQTAFRTTSVIDNVKNHEDWTMVEKTLFAITLVIVEDLATGGWWKIVEDLVVAASSTAF